MLPRRNLLHARRSSEEQQAFETPDDACQHHQPVPSRPSTLALLELLLGATKQQQQLAELSSADPAASAADTTSPTPAALQQDQLLQSPAAVWSSAWMSLEAGHAPEHAEPQPLPARKALRGFRPFGGSLRSNAQQGRMQNQPELEKQPRQSGTPPPAGPVRHAQLYLQGLDNRAKLQLLALSLASLERLVKAVNSANIR